MPLGSNEKQTKNSNTKTSSGNGQGKPILTQTKSGNSTITTSTNTGRPPPLVVNMHRRSPSPKSSASKRLPSPNVDPQTEADMIKVKKQVVKVQRARLYLLQQLGPNSFLIGGDSPEHKYRVVIGQQSCSCAKGYFCIHLLFVMLRVFQIKENDPTLWKRQLKNFEVETLLRFYHQRVAVLSKQKVCISGKRKGAEKMSSNEALNDAAGLDESKLGKEEDDGMCPICLLDMVEGESLTICQNGCQNRLHQHCMAVWSRDCRRRKERVNCPLCRAIWTCPSFKHTLDMQGDGAAAGSNENMLSLANEDASVPHGEVIPEEFIERTSTWIPIFGHDIVACLFSRDWKIREAGLRSLSRKAVKIFNEQNDIEVKWNLAEICFNALTVICKDRVFNVYIASLRTLKAILCHSQSLADNDIERFHSLLKAIIESILMKCADSNRRIAVVSTRILVDFARPQITSSSIIDVPSRLNRSLNFLFSLLSPPSDHDPYWKWWVGRLVLLRKLIEEHFSLLLASQAEEERLVPSSLSSPAIDFDLDEFFANIDQVSHADSDEGRFEEETKSRFIEIIKFCSRGVNVRHKKASHIALTILVKITQVLAADHSALEDAKSLLLDLKPVVRQTIVRQLSLDNSASPVPSSSESISSPRRTATTASSTPSTSTASPRQQVLTPPPSPTRDITDAGEIDMDGDDPSIDESLRFYDYNRDDNPNCKQQIQEEEDEAVAMAMDISINLVHRVVPEELVKGENEDVLLYVQPDPNKKSRHSDGRHVYLESVHWSKGVLLGTGAYSSCYEAMDFKTGRLMAVKQVSFCRNNVVDQERVHQAIIEEVSLLHRLKHPHIVHCFGATQLPGHINIFMEVMPGGSVASLLSRFGPLTEGVAIKYLRQIVVALHHLHSNHILHRDIKGANVLVDATGQIVKLSDFGTAARLFSHGGTGTHEFCGQLLGTISFMAPEVIRGESYGRKCDIWSIGCVLIEMITGRPPWDTEAVSNHLALMYKIASATKPPVLPTSLSPPLRDFAVRCLESSEADRPSTRSLLAHPLFQS